MLKPEPRRYDVVALRDSRIACMKRETFHWLLDHSIAFNRFIINQINERLGLFIGLLESERLLDIDARVARAIAACSIRCCNPASNRASPFRRKRSATSPASRASGSIAPCARWRRPASLPPKYGGVTVLDLDGLRRFGG
jgi:CRP/FNR family cyclic AMP-dependent transcriptional regulator